MVELLGILFGGVFRLAPELLKWLDKKDERKHELALLDKNMDYDKLRGSIDLSKIDAQAKAAIDLEDVKGFMAATIDQMKLTGNRWIDGFNAIIRPLLALQWLILLWPSIICFTFYWSVTHGIDVIVALNAAFGQTERTFCASIASFWLVDRSLKKGLFKK